MREKELIKKLLDFKLIYKHGTIEDPSGIVAGESFLNNLMKTWGEEVPVFAAMKASFDKKDVVVGLLEAAIVQLEEQAEAHKGKFAKYHSLTNHFQTERIESVLEFNPRFKDCKWIVFEKGHGRNFSIIITKDTVHYASRKHLLGTDYEKITFGGFNKIGKEYQGLVKRVQSILRMSNDDGKYTFYGELIGEGVEVNHKINYGQKQFRIFTLAIDDVYQTPEALVDFLEVVQCSEMLIYCEGVTDSLEKALAFPNNLPTMMFKGVIPGATRASVGKGDHVREGNTIMPFDVDPHIGSEGQVFIIKHKNESYSEVNRPVIKPLTEEEKAKISLIEEIKGKFFNYITENRLSNVISKEDHVPTRQTIGNYVKLLIADASKDFLEDNAEYADVNDVQKTLSKCGSRAAELVLAWIAQDK